MIEEPVHNCGDDTFLDEQSKPEANGGRQQRGCFPRLGPAENIGIAVISEIPTSPTIEQKKRWNSKSPKRLTSPTIEQEKRREPKSHKGLSLVLELLNSSISSISEIPAIPTIGQDKRGKSISPKRRSTGTIPTTTELAGMEGKPTRRSSTATLTKTTLNSGSFVVQCWSALDDQRAPISRSSKNVLKALGVSDVQTPILDVPDGLDSGELRAEDLFPATRPISNPYQEDKEFIDGLVFLAPMSEDGIRSMLGHPAKRFMTPSKGRRSATN